MLFWLLYFVSRAVKYIWQDVKVTERDLARQGKGTAGEAMLTVVGSGDPSQVGRRFAFGDEISIGRDSDNDIRISDSFVSHHHAVIFMRNNLYIIEDLGSKNHTFVNDRQLRGKVYLRTGDLIRIGFLTLRFDTTLR